LTPKSRESGDSDTRADSTAERRIHSGLRSRTASRDPQAKQIDGDIQSEQESAPRIKPIVADRDGLAKDPRHEAKNQCCVSDLKKTAVFLVEATKQRMHVGISYLN
jgi:hypothetical protein